MSEFMQHLFSVGGVLDGFTWHAYPLGAGKDEIVDSKIMDPKFGSKVDQTAAKLQNAIWVEMLGV